MSPVLIALIILVILIGMWAGWLIYKERSPMDEAKAHGKSAMAMVSGDKTAEVEP
jgi:hypothetical protein